MWETASMFLLIGWHLLIRQLILLAYYPVCFFLATIQRSVITGKYGIISIKKKYWKMYLDMEPIEAARFYLTATLEKTIIISTYEANYGSRVILMTAKTSV